MIRTVMYVDNWSVVSMSSIW